MSPQKSSSPDLRADWVSVIEAIQSETKDEVAWTDGIIDAASRLLPRAVTDQGLTLMPREREVLTRLAFHLESGARLRHVAGAVRATISGSGKVMGVGEADWEPSALWEALVGGEVSVTPRQDGYVVVENAPMSRALRALTSREAAVVELAIRGTPVKAIAYALGISASLVSIRLGHATTKLGLLSHAELVRLAALLVDVPRSGLAGRALTGAEEDILSLLERGLSNGEIARLRMRSVRTIANQVASLLRKTRSTSRRELAGLSAHRRRATSLVPE